MRFDRVVFVCQSGELEIKAGLLAASLRDVFPASLHLTAAVPAPAHIWGDLSAPTRALLRELDVEVVPIQQAFGTRYPFANKIAALACLGNVPALLLDTDIVCMRRFALEHLEADRQVAAKPADVLTFHPGDARWVSIYARRGLAAPERRVRTTVHGALSFPYFNAGVVFATDALTLATEWMALCHDVAADETVSGKLPWLDQIALPLAVQKLGWTFTSLTETWNYPAHLRPAFGVDGSIPYLAHYHTVDVIARHAALVERIGVLAAAVPCLEALLEPHGEWTKLARGIRVETRAGQRRSWRLAVSDAPRRQG